jgi:hypothetical protein
MDAHPAYREKIQVLKLKADSSLPSAGASIIESSAVGETKDIQRR